MTTNKKIKMSEMFMACTVRTIDEAGTQTYADCPAIVTARHDDGTVDVNVFVSDHVNKLLGRDAASGTSNMHEFKSVQKAWSVGTGPYFMLYEFEPEVAEPEADAVSPVADTEPAPDEQASAVAAPDPANPPTETEVERLTREIEAARALCEEQRIQIEALQSAPAISTPVTVVPAPAPAATAISVAAPASIAAPQAAQPIQPAVTTHGYTVSPFGFLPPGAMPGPASNVTYVPPPVATTTPAMAPSTQTSFGRSKSSRTMTSSVGARAFRPAGQAIMHGASPEDVLANVGVPIAGVPGQRKPRVFFSKQGEQGQNITPPEWEEEQGEPKSNTEALDDVLAATEGDASAGPMGTVIGPDPTAADLSAAGIEIGGIIPAPDDDDQGQEVPAPGPINAGPLNAGPLNPGVNGHARPIAPPRQGATAPIQGTGGAAI